MADGSATTAPQPADVQRQIAWETRRRGKLGAPTLAAGFLYLLSEIVGGEALKGVPDVGIVQGLQPVLGGVAAPLVSPRTNEIAFISHHAFWLLAGAVLGAIALVIATFAVVFLFDAARFRRPQTVAAARPLALFGGFGLAALFIASQVVTAIATHNFTTSSDHSNAAADSALTTSTAHVIVEYANLLVGLCFLVAIVVASLNAMRVGLVNRLLGYMGMIAGILFVLPLGQTLSLISTLWLLGLGVLFIGRWPNGDPPAWAAGEARPWPSSASMRQARIEQQTAARAKRRGGGAASQAPAVAAASDATPEPSTPRQAGSHKRKRKRSR